MVRLLGLLRLLALLDTCYASFRREGPVASSRERVGIACHLLLSCACMIYRYFVAGTDRLCTHLLLGCVSPPP
jgi:L-asparaginase II